VIVVFEVENCVGDNFALTLEIQLFSLSSMTSCQDNAKIHATTFIDI